MSATVTADNARFLSAPEVVVVQKKEHQRIHQSSFFLGIEVFYTLENT